jgi:hypothetical protein
MLVKKGPARATLSPYTPRTSLERLYQRQAAIEALIESLEEYDRYRSMRLDQRERKSA